MEDIFINTHPIVQDRLTRVRDKNTSSMAFRSYMADIALFLTADATQNLALETVEIETPVQKTNGKILSGSPLIVPILRAGLALSETMAKIMPSADTAHIGLYRDEKTHKPVQYLVKLPQNLSRPVFVVDPMLATGYSMIKTLDILTENGAQTDDIRIVTLLCAPEGIKALREKYPSIPVYTAAVDEKLNEKAYIVPGLGDAGDRYFGTDK